MSWGGVALPRLPDESQADKGKHRQHEDTSVGLQSGDVPRSHWKLNSYHVMKKPKYDGKIKQSKTRRSDCKAATFMGSLEDG